MRTASAVTIVDLLGTFTVVASAVMMLLLALQRFDAGTAIFISVAACLALALASHWRFVPPRRSVVIPVVLLGVLALALRWSPFLYTEGGQDQGLYVSMSAQFQHAHGPRVLDEVRLRLPEDARAQYDKLNNDPAQVVAQRSEGWHQPGVYIKDLARSEYSLQFYPLHPVWMAAAAWAFGGDNRVYSLVLFSVLGIFMLSLLAYELAGRRAAAGFVTAALLAANPMHVFLSRFPVSENVTLFFSASALYFLLRYFRDRDAGVQQRRHLVLSVGSWGAMFLAHISGFLYAPLYLLFVLAGVMTAKSASQMRDMAAYGIGIVVVYALSLWYGDAWAFAYGFDVYRAIIGDRWALFFMQHYAVLSIGVAALVVAASMGGWRFRDQLASGWQKPRSRSVVALVLLGLVLLIVLFDLLDAYRVGFTDAYAKDSWLGERWGLSRSGLRGALHGAIVALTLYVSPFVMVFLLAPALARWRAMDGYMLAALALLVLFLFLRTSTEIKTIPYYYYGRYLGAELVPYVCVFAAVFLSRLLDEGGASRIAAMALAAAAVIWQTAWLMPQYPGGEIHRFDASIKPVIREVQERDVVLLAGGEYPALRTALDYYYGKASARVDPATLRASIRQYTPLFADIYVLGNQKELPDARYLRAVTLLRDSYQRGDTWDMFPRNSSGEPFERRLYLHRVEAGALRHLDIGDVVSFGSAGTAEREGYLGAGWSAQEANYRWTEGEAAELQLPVARDASGLVLRFQLRALNCVPVTVRVNGEVRARWSFADCTDVQERDVVVKREDIPPDGRIAIRFVMPTVKSPHDVDAAWPDTRKLGLAVMRLTVARPQG